MRDPDDTEPFAIDEVVVVAPRREQSPTSEPANPVDTRAVEVGDQGAGVSVPLGSVGPVRFSAGAGAGIDGAYAQFRATAPLPANWRLAAEYSGIVSLTGEASEKAMIGVVSPPIERLGDMSVRVGFDPLNNQPRIGFTKSF